MCSLASSEKQALLEIARRALVAAVESRTPLDDLPSSVDSAVSEGAFVTLLHRGRLRGCIGQIGTPQPIVSMVAYCAGAAALEDPRFAPVRTHELAEIDIELSILFSLQVIAPERIEIGKHGLMVTRGRKRGVLLPQVATRFGWSAERFLDETCAKAGLEQAAWRHPEARIEAFIAEVFCESESYSHAPRPL
jgi:AmmeMemoRadiSam system protein A